MNISYTQCGAPNRVTFIQRHQRRIINLDELMEASRSAGYNNTQTVTFEKMKLMDQMRAAYCTDVLVGIQGEWFLIFIFKVSSIRYVVVHPLTPAIGLVGCVLWICAIWMYIRAIVVLNVIWSRLWKCEIRLERGMYLFWFGQGCDTYAGEVSLFWERCAIFLITSLG